FDKKASLLRNLGEQIGFAPKAQICFANPNLFLPYPLEPSKTFAQGKMGFGISLYERVCENNAPFVVRVILRPSFKTAKDAQMLHRRKESELSLSACRLCADGQPLCGYPSQNDVKVVLTSAVKV
ncbi:MAG: hypothetical protein IJW69_00630, partial [Clostridia bacterium]|nr:hypothetical protein [Clostridia bacterium]